MKLNQLITILLCFGLICGMFSCNMHIEKRRYRPGYHISVIKNHQRDYSSEVRKKTDMMETGSVESKIIEETHLPEPVKELPKIVQAKREKSNTHGSEIISNPVEKNKKVDFHLRQHRHPNKIKDIKGNAPKGRVIAAWIIAAIGVIVGIIAFTLSGGWFTEIMIALGFGIMAFFGLIAMLVRFAGVKKEIEHREKFKDGKPTLKEGFKKFSFIYTICVMAIALIAFIFAFIAYPGFTVAVSLGGICLGALLFSMGFGFRILKEDKSMRTKLTIIFAFIALLLAILAIVMACVLVV